MGPFLCRECGQQIDANTRFCTACGASQLPESAVPKNVAEKPRVRTTGLKLAVGWVAFWQVVVSILELPSALETITPYGSIAINTFWFTYSLTLVLIAVALVGAWMLRSWARWLLLLLIVIEFFSLSSERLEFSVEKVMLIFLVAGNGVAWRELRKATQKT